MKHLIPLIFVVIAIAGTGCKKADKESDFVFYYTGYIYRLSDSTPYANTDFICYQGKHRSFINNPEEKIIPFTTDDSGFFSFDMTFIGASTGPMVCSPGRYFNNGCPENNSDLAAPDYGSYSKDVGIIYMP